MYTSALPRPLEYLVLFFGHLFNRGLIILSIITSGVLAIVYPERIEKRLLDPELIAISKLSLTRIYVLFNMIQIIVLFIITSFLKRTFRRRRPLYSTSMYEMAPEAP